jgi:(R,R)-butanediol dehydrogenase / meso-butanediol dehydrogenase / diacetyl reductase
MRAALLYGPQDVRVEDVPEPEPGPGEVQLAVAHNGLCGSDLHVLHSGQGDISPQILGHEFAGTVTAVGEGVPASLVGSRAAIRPYYTCGVCSRCTSGWPEICEKISFHGYGGHGGGLSELTVVPLSMVVPLPDGVSLEEGALVEPMSVAYHAVQLAGAQAGQRAVVFGAGPIGLGTFLALKAKGIEDILVVDPADVRRKVVAGLGAETADPGEIDVVAEVQRRTNGSGVELAFDCAGVAATFEGALRSVGGRGTVGVVAIHMQPVSVTLPELIMAERRIVGSLAYEPDDFPAVIELMRKGAYPLTGWVEHIPLEEVMGEGFRALEAGRKVKVLVDL